MSPVRVLIVDDFHPWTRLVCSIVQEDCNLEVVGISFDGHDALCKAEDLRPDLVLLDIDLPKLNGIEVARKLQKNLPDTKIVFLSQFESSDLVNEALAAGGAGYVLKIDAAEICDAIKTTQQGERFLSRNLSMAATSAAAWNAPPRSYPGRG